MTPLRPGCKHAVHLSPDNLAYRNQHKDDIDATPPLALSGSSPFSPRIYVYFLRQSGTPYCDSPVFSFCHFLPPLPSSTLNHRSCSLLSTFGGDGGGGGGGGLLASFAGFFHVVCNLRNAREREGGAHANGIRWRSMACSIDVVIKRERIITSNPNPNSHGLHCASR